MRFLFIFLSGFLLFSQSVRAKRQCTDILAEVDSALNGRPKAPELVEPFLESDRILGKFDKEEGLTLPEAGVFITNQKELDRLPVGEFLSFLQVENSPIRISENNAQGIHVQLGKLQPVYFAGELKKELFEGGRLRIIINNKSKTYQGGSATLKKAVKSLLDAGIYADEWVLQEWDIRTDNLKEVIRLRGNAN